MEALGIDFKLLLAQIVNFVLFYLIFKKYLAEPFFKYLKKIEKDEKEKDKILAAVREKETEINKKEEEVLDSAHKQGLKILNEAKETSNRIRNEALKEAREEQKGLITKLRKQLKEEKRNLYRQFRTHLIEISSQMVESVLKKFIDEKHQAAVIERLIKQIEKRKKYES